MRLKALYESMGPADEPPFPANGLGPIYKAIAAAQQKLLIEGPLSVAVQVNSLGEASFSIDSSIDRSQDESIRCGDPYETAL